MQNKNASIFCFFSHFLKKRRICVDWFTGILPPHILGLPYNISTLERNNKLPFLATRCMVLKWRRGGAQIQLSLNIKIEKNINSKSIIYKVSIPNQLKIIKKKLFKKTLKYVKHNKSTLGKIEKIKKIFNFQS